MRIVFSRKGFDSQAGGRPSPIVDGRPISLPIPTNKSARSRTCYDDAGLGELVETVTKRKIERNHLCHEDPMFDGRGRCLFGQCGAAQSHLGKHGVAVGDVFLFFGLFAGGRQEPRHHRIFGYLAIDRVFNRPIDAGTLRASGSFAREHPHTLGEWPVNNTVYAGCGATTRSADPRLRLTQEGGPVSRWVVPGWLRDSGLTYHRSEERWMPPDRLQVVAKGQEFVSDVGDRPDAAHWLRDVIEAIRA